MKELRRLGYRSASLQINISAAIQRGVQRASGKRCRSSDGWNDGRPELTLHSMLKAVEIRSSSLLIMTPVAVASVPIEIKIILERNLLFIEITRLIAADVIAVTPFFFVATVSAVSDDESSAEVAWSDG
jgi:hypothetical protein